MTDKGRMNSRAERHRAFDVDDLARESALMETGTQQAPRPADGAARGIPISRILPDPIQPRRAMPEEFRAHWISGSPIADVISAWRDAVEGELEETGLPPDAESWLVIDTEHDQVFDRPARDLTLRPYARMWVELLRLAASILQAGLEQPITVYEWSEDLYRVQAGERRLLAYHVLNYYRFANFEAIPALVREAYDPLRQAAENGARQDLNAIGTARQIALLLLSLHGYDLTADQQPDRAWYATAADLAIPYGRAQQFAVVVGLASPRMVQRHKQLLLLPSAAWLIADEMNWTEGKIRGLMSRAANDDQLIAIANEQMRQELGLVDRPKLTQREKAIRRVRSAHQAITRAAEMPDADLAALPPADIQQLRQAALQLLRRLK